MLPEMPSSRRRFSAWCRRSSTMRSPALSWMTSSATSSHSGRRVLRMEPRVEIEPGSVLEEHVGVAGAGDDLLEQVPRDVVGRQAALTVEGAGEAVLVLEAEDPPLHGPVLPKRNPA